MLIYGPPNHILGGPFLDMRGHLKFNQVFLSEARPRSGERSEQALPHFVRQKTRKDSASSEMI